ncbi:hypothetical protein GCM10022198_15510 [Klugiella xanthotipulae]|uniref:Membrane protein YfhO n=1 Tax=Klugiella xanthotipulae TaxID=244735 RepID=A0A543HH20_9MICO|nr:hypothetical protein [Klugiella xanthotipulae]TQM57587.1 hypothetical protein FB466_2582 [Klugiella xanthotipulae]
MSSPSDSRPSSAWLLTVERVLSSTALRRGITLTACIVLLQLAVFLTFYTGQSIPPYDFLGAYAGDAFVWWTDGGFFNRTEWVPYVWAGYPSASGLQNSGWYLPTGIITLFGPYSLHLAAILAAMHVAFGAYGMYFLLRVLRAPFFVALFASVAMFFGVGFFSNASHIDIARAYAWMPWVLLVLTPLWKWNRWWSIPVATLIVWQALTGIYPGTTVAAVYVLVPWVVVVCLVYRPRVTAFLLPLAVSGVVALLLSMPRLLPYFLLNGGGDVSRDADSSRFTPSVLGTVLFSYDYKYDIPNDVTMRSFFIPVAVLVLALFARWSDPLCKLACALGVPALLLGMPFLPWYNAVQSLPGLGLSRFTMSDFKLFLVLAAILLACSGLRRLTSTLTQPRVTRGMAVSLTLASLLVIGFSVLAVSGRQTKSEVVYPLLLLGFVVALVTVFVVYNNARDSKWFASSARGGLATLFSIVIILATAGSGLLWAYTTPGPWNVNREAIELKAYGATIDSLISQRADNTGELTQRPARAPLPEDLTRKLLYNRQGNAAFFSGEYSVAGYINLRGSESLDTLEQTLLTSDIRHEFAAFLALPGTILAVSEEGRTTKTALSDCVQNEDCGVDATPVSYSPGEYVYQVSLTNPTVTNLNEAYFPGWSAEACFADGDCVPLTPELSPYGTIQLALPSGDFELSLSYSPPGRGAGWVLFGSGLMILLVTIATTVVTTRRREVTE